MRGVTVVKVGGNEVEDAPWVREFASCLAGNRPLVVVHGGGREITALQARFGAAPEWRDGLRVSSAETVRLAAMVLSGVVNKRLVSALLSAGIDAIGLSGEDGALITAERAMGGALGRTGVVTAVRAELLRSLLALGLVPVVSPISRGRDGAPLNVNADDAAAAVAVALGAERLFFVSNVPGVAIDDVIVAHLAPTDAEEAIRDGGITGGMAPKVRAAARATAGCVEDVRIGGMAMLDGGPGTRMLADMAVLADMTVLA